jgi:CRISPR/Cas system Type II protein with McrA/HNH and RuvC-like nuclease domain
MDRKEAKSLELVAKMMEHLQEEDEEIVAEMVLEEGKDSKRLYRGEIRTTIYKRHDGQCFYCGRQITGRFHIDHVIPHVLGGRTSEKNGVLSCPTCNLKKGKKVW